ncbi:MAG TPA: Hsp20/alpha crystallin family protein [Thermodesulfobacteriota bacterium]|nr:Hsp20/alpha crystallin family protein [Thermodesulfobacteriota bacterium]
MARETTLWKPFEFDRMKKEMDRIWDSFLEGKPETKRRETGKWVASIDISETKNELIIRAELPGMDPNDIDVSVNHGYLTIRGEKKQEKEEEEEENYHLIERTYGAFSRSIRLPIKVQGDKIHASFKNGVLVVRIPKSGESKKKEIKVKVE